jgi:hypothetical protein
VLANEDSLVRPVKEGIYYHGKGTRSAGSFEAKGSEKTMLETVPEGYVHAKVRE